MKKMKNNMKKILMVAMGLLMVCGAAMAKKNSDGTPAIKFTERIYDFGIIPNDRPASHDFEFINDGDANLVIVDATAECGCTRPEFSEKPIAPGKKSKVKVTYNPVGRPGSFEKTVTVKTNGNPRKVRLKIRGTVKE